MDKADMRSGVSEGGGNIPLNVGSSTGVRDGEPPRGSRNTRMPKKR